MIGGQAHQAAGAGALPARRGPSLAFWGAIGLIAQAAFTAGWLVAETWQGPAYSMVTDTISDMQAATAPYVWFPVTCFALGGVGTCCFAVFGLRPALAQAGQVAGAGPWVLAAAGLAIGNSFPLAPCEVPQCAPGRQLYSPGGLTDAIVATMAFLVIAYTPILLRRRLKVLPAWRPMVPVITAARIVCPACYLLLCIASLTSTAEGLAERALATSCVLWIAALAAWLIHVAGHERRSDRPA
ncbi:MAG TPA: DUF998 domain-containing protein [Streptosporangiaceae bacterium]|nr:DUF998 domain-containing protein [Streptosporangiaceae bacterium]